METNHERVSPLRLAGCRFDPDQFKPKALKWYLSPPGVAINSQYRIREGQSPKFFLLATLPRDDNGSNAENEFCISGTFTCCLVRRANEEPVHVFLKPFWCLDHILRNAAAAKWPPECKTKSWVRSTVQRSQE